MIISISEFKAHLGKYLDMTEYEDLFITKHGKIIKKIINARGGELSEPEPFPGALKDENITKGSIRAERRAEYFEKDN